MDFLNDGGLSRLQCLAFLIVVNENQVLFSTGFITMGTTLDENVIGRQRERQTGEN